MKKLCFHMLAGLTLWLTLAAEVSGQTAVSTVRLGQARLLVEQKQYAQALDLYEEIELWLWRDLGLIIEMARVYTYDDRHADAIRLFEEVRTRHPEKQYEFLTDLGYQYCWNGQPEEAVPVFRAALEKNSQDMHVRLGLGLALRWAGRHEEAIEAYDLVLAQQPNNIDALNGKADSLSRIDQMEEAIALYQQVTAIEPDNTEALAGIARCTVWQGYHRQGRELYLGILEKFPDNPDALEGLAFAHHWDGRNDLANRNLNELLNGYPDRSAALRLRDDIQYSQEPVVIQENRYRKNKYEESVQQHRLQARMYVSDVTFLDAMYDWRRFRDPNSSDMDVQRVGIGGGHKFNDLVELNSFWHVSEYDETHFTPLTTDSWLTLRPNDYWRFDVAYSRETYESRKAAIEHIVMDSGSLSADFRPNRYLLFSGKYKHSAYSDDNEQKSFLGKAELRLSQKPYVKLYYNFYRSTWADQYNNGYFNPKRFNAHSLGLYTGFYVTDRLFCEAQASYGYEWQVPTAENPAYFAAAGFRYRIGKNWHFMGRGEFFEARPDTGNNSGGYRERMIFIGISHNFGEPSGDVPESKTMQIRSR